LTCDFAKLQQGLALAASSVTETATPPVDPDGPEPPVEHTPPVAFGDAFTTPQDGPAHALDVVANDSFPDGAFDSLEIVTEALHGTMTVSGRVVTYQPTAGYSGADEYRYTVTDTNGVTSNIAVVAVTVTPTVIPPVEPPTPALRKFRGYHGPHGQNQGAPVAVWPGYQRCEQVLGEAGMVALWPLMESPNLLLPGRGMPANIYRDISNAGKTALLTMPILWRHPMSSGRGGEGDWDAVTSGLCDDVYKAHYRWAKSQGQTRMRIRIGHEQGSHRWFPHSIGFTAPAELARRDFRKVKAATEHAMKIAKDEMPDAEIVYCHFWQSHFNAAGGVKTYVHPDEFAADKRFYDIGACDVYDGKGNPWSAANASQMDNETRDIPGHGKAPWGPLAWQKYFKALGKPFAVCEMGIVCLGEPARDNEFYINHMFDLAEAGGWLHLCAFNPYDQKATGKHQMFDATGPKTKAGTRKAPDAWRRRVGA
jgi:hypothetical protein